MMMMDLNQNVDVSDDDDSDRTETYTPPPPDVTIDYLPDEKENKSESYCQSKKEQSMIILDESDEQPTTASTIKTLEFTPPRADDSLSNPGINYWDQWPLVNNDLDDDERLKLYSIPDIDIPPSPPSAPAILSSPMITETTTTKSPTFTETIKILDLLTNPSFFTESPKKSRKQPNKRKKKKKPLSEYRPPSPFSPKPDYKSMDIDQLKTEGMRFGLSSSLSKGRLIKILDEIYHYTHQYETDTDFESDIELPKERPEKKDLQRTPPTPAVMPDVKKVKKRPVVLHPMSSSDDPDGQPSGEPSAKKASLTSTDDEKMDQDEAQSDRDHEGRFLELTVYELSSSTASSHSASITGTPPTLSSDGHPSDTKKMEGSTNKKAAKRPKLQTPTMPLKDILRSYIESNPTLHARVLCYEPIDFEEFHKQMKSDLNMKIVSKELMQCLDDQCITFTLRSRKGAFTSVMRAKRRHK